MIDLLIGDCLTHANAFKGCDAFLPDPPANIGFMGRSWDKAAAEAYEPPIPARSKAHLRELQSEYAFERYWGERFGMMYDQGADDCAAFVWALPRTAHQTATALRWAGWRILDVWHHIFAQGWPKNKEHLKPAVENWIIAIKGKPALGIERCRVPRGEPLRKHTGGEGSGITHNGFANGAQEYQNNGSHPANLGISHHPDCVRVGERKVKASGPACTSGSGTTANTYGKFAARSTVTHRDEDGTETIPAYQCAPGCPVAELDAQSGNRPGMNGGGKHRNGAQGGMFGAIDCEHTTYADQGGASRFFNTFGYYAKAGGSHDSEGVPRGERHAGCEELYWRGNPKNPFGFDQITRAQWEALEVEDENEKCVLANERRRRTDKARGNVHPTVKSIEMMMHIVKLSGGKRIGDLCLGSGGTAIACQLLGLDFVGTDICPEAVTIGRARLAYWSGLTFDALEQFKLTGDLPKVAKPIGNLTLF